MKPVLFSIVILFELPFLLVIVISRKNIFIKYSKGNVFEGNLNKMVDNFIGFGVRICVAEVFNQITNSYSLSNAGTKNL